MVYGGLGPDSLSEEDRAGSGTRSRQTVWATQRGCLGRPFLDESFTGSGPQGIVPGDPYTSESNKDTGLPTNTSWGRPYRSRQVGERYWTK